MGNPVPLTQGRCHPFLAFPSGLFQACSVGRRGNLARGLPPAPGNDPDIGSPSCQGGASCSSPIPSSALTLREVSLQVLTRLIQDICHLDCHGQHIIPGRPKEVAVLQEAFCTLVTHQVCGHRRGLGFPSPSWYPCGHLRQPGVFNQPSFPDAHREQGWGTKGLSACSSAFSPLLATLPCAAADFGDRFLGSSRLRGGRWRRMAAAGSVTNPLRVQPLPPSILNSHVSTTWQEGVETSEALLKLNGYSWKDVQGRGQRDPGRERSCPRSPSPPLAAGTATLAE